MFSTKFTTRTAIQISNYANKYYSKNEAAAEEKKKVDEEREEDGEGTEASATARSKEERDNKKEYIDEEPLNDILNDATLAIAAG